MSSAISILVPTPSVALTINGSLYLVGIEVIAENPPILSIISTLLVFLAKGFIRLTKASPFLISTPEVLYEILFFLDKINLLTEFKENYLNNIIIQ